MELPSLPFEIVNLPTIEYNYAIQIGSYFVIIMNVLSLCPMIQVSFYLDLIKVSPHPSSLSKQSLGENW